MSRVVSFLVEYWSGQAWWMRLGAGIGAFVVLLLFVVGVLGLTTSEAHVVRVVADLGSGGVEGGVESVYEALKDVESWDQWGPGIVSMEPAKDTEKEGEGGGAFDAILDVGGKEPLRFEILECKSAPSRLVRVHWAGPSSPLEATWTFSVEDNGLVRLVEHGKVSNPMIRGVMVLMGARSACATDALRAFAKYITKRDIPVRQSN